MYIFKYTYIYRERYIFLFFVQAMTRSADPTSCTHTRPHICGSRLWTRIKNYSTPMDFVAMRSLSFLSFS